MDVLLLLARMILFAVFVVSGLSKLFDLVGSRQAMRDFGLPEPLANPAGLTLPIAELVVAILLLPVATAAWGGLGALVLLLLFIAGMSYNLARGRRPDCHCFGQIHSAPIGRGTIIRNAVLALIAAPVAWIGFADDPGPSLVGWLGDLSGVGWVLLVGGLVLLGALAGVAWLLTHLLGQNGRLLVRLDAVEAALIERGMLPETDDDEDEEAEEGLAIGAPAPAFSLTGLQGETMTLDALRATGKPVLLIFSDPNCGPCNALLPDIGRWQRENGSQLTTAMVTRGTADANRSKSTEHGLTHVLLQKDSEVADIYQTNGTPTGVIVRADGTIGSRPAPGTDAIRNLVTRALNGTLPTADEKRPRPAPPPAPVPAPNLGKPAPELSLPDLAGKTVSLADFKGSPTALLFWNPGCGFCQRMVDDLKKWETAPPEKAPKLLVVSTGEAEANAAHGFQSAIVLDQGFNAGRSFGASGTPSAVLVDAEGNIASGVAVGAPSVLGLLSGNPPESAPTGNGAMEPDEVRSPKIGQPAPPVKLPDLTGATVDLAEHGGTRTLVLFWNPGCGFCQQMLPDLKKWEAKPPKGAPKLVVVSSGSVEDNQALGLRSPVLLDPNFAVGTAFGTDGTPSAIMIDARGNIASALAVGAPEVMKLARSTKDPAPAPTRV